MQNGIEVDSVSVGTYRELKGIAFRFGHVIGDGQVLVEQVRLLSEYNPQTVRATLNVP